MPGEIRTRFRIFVQSPIIGPPFDTPQPITVDRAPSAIAPGPTDIDDGSGAPLLAVLDAKKSRYPSTMPHRYDANDGRPWRGACHAKAEPGPDGHFDHLDPQANPRPFAQAAVYASVRFTLERWQGYFASARRGGVRWHHRPQRGAGGEAVDAALELNPWSTGLGARAGYGFIEFGHGPKLAGQAQPQALWRNFDVIAHEVGHSLLFSVLGFPENLRPDMAWYGDENLRRNGQFLAFHESAGDLVAMITSLHHDAVITRLVDSARRNPFRGASVVANFGELRRADPDDLSKLSSIRNAASAGRITGVSLRDDGPHRYSLPLTGALYGLLADEFERQRAACGRREALLRARDYLGELLARAWSLHLSPDRLTFSRVRRAVLAADRDIGGHRRRDIVRNFNDKGIR